MNATMNCTFPYPFSPNPYPPSELTCVGMSLGSEFLVSTNLFSSWPKVASLSDGGFVVVWVACSSSLCSVYGQMYNSEGTTVGSEFQVNTGSLYEPSAVVTGLNDGSFVVVWSNVVNPSEIDAELYGQIYNSTGGAIGGEFQVTGYFNWISSIAAVASLSDGGFVVVWVACSSSLCNVYGQMYNSAGTAEGSTFLVNTDSLYSSNPAVASLDDGGFIVVWSGLNFSPNVYGQMYNSAGTAEGSTFLVSTVAEGISPVVAGLDGGGFIVLWGPCGNNFGQVYSSTRTAVGSTFLVDNVCCYTNPFMPCSQVASLSDGGFIVMWVGGFSDVYGQMNNSYGQLYNNTGGGYRG